MKLSTEYLLKAIEIATGIVVGVLTWKISDDGSSLSALLSVVVGLLCTMILIFLIESFRQQADIQKVKSTYENLITLICEGKNRSDEKMSYILKYGVVTFEDRHMPNVWRDLLWDVNRSYYATNYINSDEIYDQSWADAALAIQKAKSFGEHVDIKKIFIVDDNVELEGLKATFKNQLDAGINVRYIMKSAIDKSVTLRTKSNEIRSIDFGIFDDKSVFLWKLKNRSFVGGEVKFKVDEINLYKQFFNQLFSESKLVDSIG